jgi:hypothetical protein
VNVQACCDANSRFTAVSIGNSGSTHDSLAFRRWSLSYINIPDGYFLLGDNAYKNSNSLLTPYSRALKDSDPYKDSFCFHLSQLRIRIEMAFGLLTMKFQILKMPLTVPVSKISLVLLTCMLLHNFIISERLLKDPNYELDPTRIPDFPMNNFRNNSNEPLEVVRGRWYPWGHPDYEFDPTATYPNANEASGALRTAITEYLRVNRILRPATNIASNAERLNR